MVDKPRFLSFGSMDTWVYCGSMVLRFLRWHYMSESTIVMKHISLENIYTCKQNNWQLPTITSIFKVQSTFKYAETQKVNKPFIYAMRFQTKRLSLSRRITQSLKKN